jgi:hypothetical protein
MSSGVKLVYEDPYEPLLSANGLSEAVSFD